MGAVVQGVTGVGMAQPVRGDLTVKAGFFRRGIDDAADLRGIERTSSAAAGKDGAVRLGAFEGEKLIPKRLLQEHGTRLASLAEDGDLPALLTRNGVRPFEAAQFADADARCVKQLQQDAVAANRGGFDE